MSYNSLKNLFEKDSQKIIAQSSSLGSLGNKAESEGYLKSYKIFKERVVPQVDFSHPKNWVRYGSAKQYYIDAAANVYDSYPYDGSEKEKIQWHNTSSYFENYVFDAEYPRTNGHIALNNVRPSPGSGNYGSGGDIQYILTTGSMAKDNIYDLSKGRAENLFVDLSKNGSTVEFWLKKNGFLGTDKTRREVVYDLWNHELVASTAYGRLRIEMDSSFSSGSVFLLTAVSGTAGVKLAKIGATGSHGAAFTTSKVGDNKWHHYAFTFKNAASNIECEMYHNGNYVETILTGSVINAISGGISWSQNKPIVSTIGALAHRTSYAQDSIAKIGHGGLSASVDDFRFWKTRRTAKEIGINWFAQVAGGTNNDDANTNLGLYYKFNEGITGEVDTDEIILDYSGRVSNGTFYGYTANNQRATGSALVNSSYAKFEFKDPIVYKEHPDVDAYITQKQLTGSLHDDSNTSYLYYTFPQWILEDDEGGELHRLTQIMASYFDTLHLQIAQIHKIKSVNYPSGTQKPHPFMNQLLQDKGFYVSELFNNSDLIETYINQTEDFVIKDKLHDIKNRIYQNIYNNLTYIYKTKGTEQSVKSLLRCLGLGDDLVRINYYGNNSEYQFRENFRSATVKKRFLSMVDSHFTGTVYQSSASFLDATNANIYNVNAVSYLQGGAALKEIPLTLEANVYFRKKFPENSEFTDGYTDLTSSIIGMHTIDTSGDFGEHSNTWSKEGFNTPGSFEDAANLHFLVEKHPQFKHHARFHISGSYRGAVAMSSSWVKNVYDNEHWNLSARIRPKNHEQFYTYTNLGKVGAAATAMYTSASYELIFHGAHANLGTIEKEFTLSKDLTFNQATAFLTSSKKIYAGAHRINYTGSVIDKSDVDITSVRFWHNNLTDDELHAHIKDITNYGVEKPYGNSLISLSGVAPHNDQKYMNSLSGAHVPNYKTLALHWNFENISGSNSAGAFDVWDFSSASAPTPSNAYNDFTPFIEKYNSGVALGFKPNSNKSVIENFVFTSKQQLPETLNSSDQIEIKKFDEEIFYRTQRPTTYFAAIEKSPYQIVSDEMIDMFATVLEFNNMIGHPVHRYRLEYKQLNKLRELFFQRVGKSVDFDRFLEFYKWVDFTINKMLESIVPVSANISGDIRTVVESHLLERNKYKHPFVRFVDISFEPEFKPLPPHHGLNSVNNGLPPAYQQMSKQTQGGASDPTTQTTMHALHGGGGGTTGPINQITNYYANPEKGSKTLRNREITERNKNTVGVTNVDVNREILRKNILVSLYNRRLSPGVSAGVVFPIEQGGNQHYNKKINFEKDVLPFRGASENNSDHIKLKAGELNQDYGLQDIIVHRKDKERYSGEVKLFQKNTSDVFVQEDIVSKVDIVTPFTIYSHSGPTNSQVSTNFKTNYEFTNLHHDSYSSEIPLQSPFTNEHVGGLSYRHTPINVVNTIKTSVDDELTRAEGWRIRFATDVAATATFTFSDKPNETTTITLIDAAGTSVIFEVDNDGDGAAGTNTAMDPPSNNAAGMSAILISSVNASSLQITATTGGGATGEVLLTQDVKGEAGNSIIALSNYSNWNANTTAAFPINFTDGADKTAKIHGPGGNGFHKPRSSFYRQGLVKRPVNIRNIKTMTSSINGLRVLGNYINNYELVQTVGADVNNLWLVHHTGNLPSSGSDAKSIVFKDLYDFKVDERSTLRDLTTRQKTVINDRFSAPGGPEVNSLGFLDEASRTYSVYNNLNYRNLSVRQPLNTLLSEAEGKYEGNPGFNLRRTATGSFHEVHNNHMVLLKRPASTVLTSSVYNNGFIITPTPSSDRQYSWITASLNTHDLGDSAPLRYAHPSGEERKTKSGGYIYTPSITFLSSSEISSYIAGGARQFGGFDQLKQPTGRAAGTRLAGDFVGLNYHLVSAVTASENFLSSSGFNTKLLTINANAVRDTLNTWLLKHNGPYHYPSFKQIRTGEHPVARHMRENNRICIQKPARLFTDDQGNYYKEMRSPHFRSFTEPVVTSKYKPLEHRFLYKPDGLDTVDAANKGQGLDKEVKRDPNQLVADLITLEHTYGNKLASFSRNEIDRLMNVKVNTEDLPYGDLTAMYLYKGLTKNSSPIEKFVSLNYRERVWPREKNEYISKTYIRKEYFVSFWRENRNDRTVTNPIPHESWTDGDEKGFLNAFGKSWTVKDQGGGTTAVRPCIGDTGSLWPLDARSADNLGNTSFETSITINGLGTAGDDHGTGSIAPMISGALGQLWSIYPQWNTIDATAETAGVPKSFASQMSPIYARRTFENVHITTGGSTTLTWMLAGDTKWEAGEQAGKQPFPQGTYENWAEDLRRQGKDFSLIPEFRISEHMDYYVNTKASDFLADREGFLTLTGTVAADSTNDNFYKDYTHSDFLKHFNIIDEHRKTTFTNNGTKFQRAEDTSITLKCKALMKFLPYSGFYPVLRTLDLASLFSASFFENAYVLSGAPNGAIADNQLGHKRPIITPYFAPGIMYNTIKSGIAVDYPVYTAANGAISLTTASYEATASFKTTQGINDYGIRLNENFSERLSFESLLDPSEFYRGLLIVDQEQHPSASYGATSNAGRAAFAETKDKRYKLAMHNFLAESMQLFVDKTPIKSDFGDTDPRFGQMSGNIPYEMFIILKKTGSFSMYDRPSAFGPPVANAFTQSTSLQTAFFTNAVNGSPSHSGLGKGSGYSPFTPPYYPVEFDYGYEHIHSGSFVKIEFNPAIFSPTLDGTRFDLLTILSGAIMTYARNGMQPFNPGASGRVTAVNNAMQVSASLNFSDTVFDFEKTAKETREGLKFGAPSLDLDKAARKFIIETKFETPMLNFKNVSATLPKYGSGSIAKGMWHQYGVLPSNPEEGVVIEIADGFEKPSLADALGIKKGNHKIGRVPSKRKVKEAIVAIPFRTVKNKKMFFSIDRERVDAAIFYDREPSEVERERIVSLAGTDVIDMVKKMRTYVLPPKFDFLTFHGKYNTPEVKPVAMYIFEFEHEFDQQDLVDIWQNLPPALGEKIKEPKESISTITHPLLAQSVRGHTEECEENQRKFGFVSLHEDLRWMVFKVKQKAEWNYYKSLRKTRGDLMLQIEENQKIDIASGKLNPKDAIQLSSKEVEPLYSYNWPYDFFSMVELAQIEADIKITPNTVDETREEIPEPARIIGQALARAAEVQPDPRKSRRPGNSNVKNLNDQAKKMRTTGEDS
jgi:hypothetical protein